MKETIEYYYNLIIDDIEEEKGKYHLKINNQDLYFIFYNRSIEELEDIIGVVNNMKEKGIETHYILKNINGEYLTKVDKYPYILLAIINKNETYDIFDIENINELLVLTIAKSNLYRNNWEKLWSEKNDYFEYQVRELALDKQVIKNSFSYYLGLSENAISYVKLSNKYISKNEKIVLSHRRISYPNYGLNYLNPLAFIFDLQVRDVAEYLKSMFFQESLEETIEELKSYLKISRLTPYEYHMFMARLLYPSYYYDIYENVMNNEEDEEKLVKIIKRVNDYEEFLKKAYLEISKYTYLEKIVWLID